MSYTSLLLRRAQKELLEAWVWYEDRQPGLGDRFKNELDKRIGEIEKHPERYPQQTRPYRETRIDVFPYLIIYRLNTAKNLVIITSVFHASRHPKNKNKK